MGKKKEEKGKDGKKAEEKKECCEKFRKKGKHCKDCPLLATCGLPG